MSDEKKTGRRKPGGSEQLEQTKKLDSAAVNAANETADNGGAAVKPEAGPSAQNAPAPRRNRYADKMNKGKKKLNKKARIAIAAGLVVIAAAAGVFFVRHARQTDTGDTTIQTAEERLRPTSRAAARPQPASVKSSAATSRARFLRFLSPRAMRSLPVSFSLRSIRLKRARSSMPRRKSLSRRSAPLQRRRTR